MSLRRALLVLTCACLSAAVRISTWPPNNCSRQGLRCTVNTSNCMDNEWLDVNEYTPSSPDGLKVSVDTKPDETGQLQPVLVANWTLKDDGSISYLRATELHVLVTSTNHNLCVRYTFEDKLSMRSPSGEQWSFSANVLLDPGQSYRVSVSNIPKPELDHTRHDVSADVTVPDCQDPKMQMTRFCVETGSLWQPNISLAQITAVNGRPALAVSFRPDRLCQKYIVIARCSRTTQVEHTSTGNQTTLNVTFSLDKWPRSCCQFVAEIKPLFPQCGEDCVRHVRSLDICPAVKPTDAPDSPQYMFAILGVVCTCILMAVIMCVFCRKPGKTVVAAEAVEGGKPWQQQLRQPPKVLVIYSQDHHLYRDIVLKLCAFLQAKCGTKVLVDLLDSTSVGMVGRLRWLEWQRQKLNSSSDKILVLCSRGVQAKWRAMCGNGCVTLREDVLSPTDDMLTPFLNLYLPDMHQAGMQGKYMVAYFDAISSEQDVPSVFDITVKYKLMKHFEELFFRILDMEKYQPGQVKHIDGIGGDEYFNCPSGRALRDAIESFQAYQLENPDWFEQECVDSEEDVTTEADSFIDKLPPVLECVPLIRDEPPLYIHEVRVNEDVNSVHVLTPELNTECQLSSVAELRSVVNPECKHPSDLDEVVASHVYPRSPSPASVYIAQPVLNKLPPPRQNWPSLQEEPFGQIPTEDEEEDSLLPMMQFSGQSDQRSSALQNSLDFNSPQSSRMPSEYFPPPEISHSQPVEMEEDEVLDPRGPKGPSSGSDQGYISKVSTQLESPNQGIKDDPLAALRRLQEELFQTDLMYSGLDPEGN